MNDPIHDLLCEADASVAPPRRIEDLADAARRTAGARQRIRSVSGAVVVLLLGASLVFVSFKDRRGVVADSHAMTPQQIEQARRDLAELDQQAQYHERLAQRIAEREPGRRPAARERAGWIDASRVRRDLDEAAFSIVYQGDRLARQPDLATPAADLYRQVIADFPGSSWAPVARERLARLNERKEG